MNKKIVFIPKRDDIQIELVIDGETNGYHLLGKIGDGEFPCVHIDEYKFQTTVKSLKVDNELDLERDADINVFYKFRINSYHEIEIIYHVDFQKQIKTSC